MIKRNLIILLLITSLFINPHSINPVTGNENKVKNIIIMIGDGMGFEHIRAASWIEYGNETGLFMQSSVFMNTSMTNGAVDKTITDSAASGTAMASGIKTKVGYLGVYPNGSYTKTILEIAEELGKSTGLVTTSKFNHATPAAFASHVPDRNDVASINEHMAKSGVEVIFGGGQKSSLSSTQIQENNYEHITTKNELQNLDISSVNKILGTFEKDHLSYEADLDYKTDVRLRDMVAPALKILERDEDGMFLMIEGGRIDHAAHARNLTKNILETIEFDYSVKMVYNWMQKNPDTLLLVVADHETGDLKINSASNLDSNIPYYRNTEDEKRTQRIQRIKELDAKIRSSSHTDKKIPLKIYGKNADQLVDLRCDYSNAHVFGIMNNAYNGIFPSECPLPISSHYEESPIIFSIFAWMLLVISIRFNRKLK